MDENGHGPIVRGFGFAKKVILCMLLKKKMQGDDEENELGRFIQMKDNFLITTGVILASFYIGMPSAVNTYGYMFIFPLLISGIMSFITSVCFAELVSLNPNSGGSYRYVYYTMGELMAFLVGWSCIYTSFLDVAHKAALITKKIDLFYLNGQVANFTSTYLPIGGLENYFLHIHPNAQLQNIFMLLVIAGTCAVGTKRGTIAIDIAAFFNIVVICSCLTIFWFYMDFSKFNILGATKDFSFFTEGSVEGHMFYMGFEVTIFCGAESVNPTVSIPTGLVEGIHMGFFIYITSIILYSAREGAMKKGTTVMTIALKNLGLKNFCMLPPLGHIVCYYLCGIAAMYKGSRVMYTMAKDGLIFPIFGHVHPRLKNPFYNHIFMGVICCIVSIFIGITPSTKWTIVAFETIIRIMVLLAYLVTRYMCESDDLSHEADHKKRWVLTNCPHSLSKPTKTTHTISMLLILLSVTTITLAELIILFYIIESKHKQICLRLGFIISVLIAFISIHLLNQQPTNDHRHLLYKVRGVPYSPILAITWYTLILMFLPPVIWVKIFCWLIIGLLFYFSYACLHSKEYKKQKDSGSFSGISLPKA